MAFLKKKSKLPVVVLRGFLLLIILGVLFGGLFVFYQKQMTELKKQHEEETQQFQFQLYQLERKALVPKADIEYGTALSAALFDEVSMKLELEQDLLLDEADMGKTNMVMLPKGVPVTKSAVIDAPPANDLRKVEFNMILIQTDQLKGDFVDIRIVFPNAENYIVLGKKQIKEMKTVENIIWLWLDETEIHLISSAIIDAYLHPGTKLYATTYIQPEMQAAATPYYPANPNVLDLMRTDPNILKKASDALAREARALLESHLQMMTMDEVTKVTTGVGEEISKTSESIKNEELNRALQEKQDQQIQQGMTDAPEVTAAPDDKVEVPKDPYN